MDISDEKNALRRELRRREQAYAEEYIQSADAAIFTRVTALPAYAEAKTLFIFVSVGREVNTHALINHALTAGKRVVVPRCQRGGCLELRQIGSLAQLKPTGKLALLEPDEKAPLISPDEVDFAVVPCAGCDIGCRRLGKGGGYYDRLLGVSSFTTAALCRERSLLEGVPCEVHDIPVDMVVTEKDVYIKQEDR